jgi:hypothetical protein
MYACWSVKGGSGTTVFASALALLLAERHGQAVLIDICGDVPSALGIAEPAGRGMRDWLSQTREEREDLSCLYLSATSRLRVIPTGSATSFAATALDDLLGVLPDAPVVIDFGALQPPDSVRHAAQADWLVVRPCYLALRRAARLTQRPGGVVLLKEHGRALTTKDVQSVVGAPVVAEITVADRVARSVDAGLLSTRLPTQLAAEIGVLL